MLILKYFTFVCFINCVRFLTQWQTEYAIIGELIMLISGRCYNCYNG